MVRLPLAYLPLGHLFLRRTRARAMPWVRGAASARPMPLGVVMLATRGAVNHLVSRLPAALPGPTRNPVRLPRLRAGMGCEPSIAAVGARHVLLASWLAVLGPGSAYAACAARPVCACSHQTHRSW